MVYWPRRVRVVFLGRPAEPLDLDVTDIDATTVGFLFYHNKLHAPKACTRGRVHASTAAELNVLEL